MTHECDRDGCENKATLCPEVEIRNGQGAKITAAVIGLRICGACALKTRIEDVITDATWGGLVGQLPRAWRRAVSRKRSALGMIPLDSEGARVSLERRERLEREQAARTLAEGGAGE